MTLGKKALTKFAQVQQPGRPGGPPPGGFRGFFPDVNQRRAQHAQYESQQVPGFAGREGNTTSPAGIGISLLQNVMGEMGTAPALLLPFVAPWVKEKTGLDLMEPIQVGYGGDPAATREAARVNREMMGRQFQESGRLVGRIADMAGEWINKIPKNIRQDWLGGLSGEAATSWVKSMPPQQLGMMYGQLAPAVPELASTLSAMDPNFIADFSPFVKMTMAQNEGRFDEGLFAQNIQNFRQAYNQGWFNQEGRPIPAQLAASAMGFARERLGNRANMAHAANIAKSADALHKQGLAQTFGGAMSLASRLGQGYAEDPSQLIQSANYLGDLARRGMIDARQMAKAADIADQQGIDPMTAMQLVGQSGVLRTQLRADAEKLLEPAAQSYAQLQKQPWAEALDKAVRFDSRYRRRLESAKERGDTTAIQRLGERAMKDRGLMRELEGIEGSGARLLGDLASTNPQLVPAMMAQEVHHGFRRRGDLGRSAQRFIARNREEVAQAMSTGDFSDLGRGSRGRRMGALFAKNPHLVASALTLDPSVTYSGTLRPRQRIKKPDIKPAVGSEPIRRLGTGVPQFGGGKRPALPEQK